MTKILKRYLPDLLVVVAMVFISFAYFFPADIEGRILYRHDASAGRGAGMEATQHYEKTGEKTRWSNSTFSGMPTYQTAPSYDSAKPLSEFTKAYHLWLPENVWYLFVYLLGFYLMLRAFDFRWYLAALGSVIWAFSSYFLIIIAAGHIWKVMALAYLPPMIGGIVLTYRGKYLWGFLVTALFAAMEVNANHVQMTYYYLFIILLMVVAYLADAIKNKQLPHFVKASAICLAAGMVGIMMNISNLYHTWEYQKESMRGKSELVKGDASNQTSSGLDRDYITQWSYGIGETWTLLIPNTKGGASMSAVSESETAMAHANNDYVGIYQQLGQYWGDQPGTSGPVYIGAFVCMMFVLALFVLDGPMLWALLVATVLSILLSWGKNFMPFTDLFLDYVPMYAKFRTVASILVIAEFTMPLLGMMALKKVLEQPDCLGKNMKWLWTSAGITAGICIIFALMPGLFFSDFVSEAELHAFSQFPPEQLNPLLANLREMRQAVFSADCWRSAFIIVIGTAVLAAGCKQKISATLTAVLLALLCLFDLWQVDKRYLNDAMFVNADVRELPQPMTETDKQILEDKSLDYRVLNFASNTFNENETSYYHKSIGGYHAAKLRRYQELIDAYIQPEMQQTMKAIVDAGGDMQQVGPEVSPVINMLNTKYFILPLQGGATTPLLNANANGNAWYVSKITYVDNANKELDGMAKINLRTEAIADKSFEGALGSTKQQDSLATVRITKYEANHLEYDATSKAGGIIVFSEIYYPGWTATVDGNPVEIGRVNYVLRAIQISAGDHKIVLDFHPTSLSTTESLAYAALALLILAFVAAIVIQVRKTKKQNGL